MGPILRRLFPDMEFISKDRFSNLSFAGSKKISRLPRRSAVVGFSADAVYSIAELIRRQRGGAAVVLGALSPRTRNAQAELFQNGAVDYLVATDAIGMGLNMDIDHIAFAARRKFDGRRMRDLHPDELGQVAGRAGRHIRDGTFGQTADCSDIDDETIEAIENHKFPAIQALQWRSNSLDFSSLPNLRLSLDRAPPGDYLRRARPGEDELAFAKLSANETVRRRATAIASISLLWDVCQIPDFRKSAFDQHARLLGEIYEQLMDHGRVAETWLAPKVESLNRTDGDIDSISTRISYIRTWTYLSNRAGWIENSTYWRGKTQSIENALSDALHEKLTQRFVDRRTSILLKKLRDNTPLLAGVTEDGEVIVEGQFVGRLLGFQFIIDPRAKGHEAKRVRAAAEKALTPVLAARAAALANAEPEELDLRPDATIWWRSSPVAHLEKGPAQFRPNLKMNGFDAISPSLRLRVFDRLSSFVASKVETQLGDLSKLKMASDGADNSELSGLARGVAFRLVENFGAMSRNQIATELKQLEQQERAKLRRLGVRFGEYTLFVPSILKPAPAKLLTLLWALWTDKEPSRFPAPKPGLVSVPVNKEYSHGFYYATGYRPSGERAIRIDMLERLAAIIRTARNDGPKEGFEVNQQMMSIIGCSGDEFEGVLTSLGFQKRTIQRAKAATAAPPNEVVSASEQDAPKAENPSHSEKETPLPNGVETDASEKTVLAAEDTAHLAAAPDSDSEQNGTVQSVSAGADIQASETTLNSDAAIVQENAASPSSPTDVETSEQEEVIVWRMAPRRPPRDKEQRRARNSAPDEKSARSGNAKGGGRPGQRSSDKPNRSGDKRNDRKKKREQPRGPRQFTAGPKRSAGPDPNSPFAVLASLKSEGDKDGPDKT